MQTGISLIRSAMLVLLVLGGLSSCDSRVAARHEDVEAQKAKLAGQISVLSAAANDASSSIEARRTAINSLSLIAPGSVEAQKALALLPVLAEDERVANIGRQWSYQFDEDRMTGAVTARAVVSSGNTISLDFPYAGAQHGRLMLRRHPRWGNDVAFSIEKGQLLCNSWDGCQVKVRFDDGRPFNVHAVEPEDGSSQTLFLSDYRKLESSIATAATMLIEVPLYKAGTQVFEFPVDGFDKERLARK